MLGTLNNDQIDTLLQSQVVGRLGCYSDDKIYVVPLTYAYDGKYIYGHTIEGLKIKMMRSNPKVCFEVEQIDNLAHWRSAIVWGEYEELNNEPGEKAVQIIVNRIHPLMTSDTSRPAYGLDKTRGAVPNRKTVVFRIKIEEKSGRFEKK